jgi:GDP/UDP-N,N'-diacetylbacillosamine 2-epimerase (hydrolysing)
MKKKIAVITGTRAEYGILKPVIEAIQGRPELELLLVASGMHLSRDFGYTASEIENDGFPISARVEMTPEDDTPAAMAKSIGAGVTGMADAFRRLQPDIILLLGDRTEPLAATIAAAYMNTAVAHIHGGDVCGNIDDPARHAITRFAHIHFPATPQSAARIIRMGEEEWRVHMVGSPALDVILNEPAIDAQTLSQKLGLDLSSPLLVVVQHPVTSQADAAPGQIRETLEAVVELGYPAVVIYPNSDAGGRSMIDVIRQYEKYPFIKVFPSLPRPEYLGVMRVASVLVGNSSSGLTEAPSLGIPVVNIGMRQEGRERGDNVIDAGHDKKEIIEAIKKAMTDKKFLTVVKKRRSPYGDGKASPRIAGILSQVEITPQLLQKRITY